MSVLNLFLSALRVLFCPCICFTAKTKEGKDNHVPESLCIFKLPFAIDKESGLLDGVDLFHILQISTSLPSLKFLPAADEGRASDVRASLQGPPERYFYRKKPECLIPLQKRKLQSGWNQSEPGKALCFRAPVPNSIQSSHLTSRRTNHASYCN